MKILAAISGYKTLIFNLLVAVAAILGKSELMFSSEEFDAAVMAIAVIGNVGMRFVTTTPVGVSAASKAV